MLGFLSFVIGALGAVNASAKMPETPTVTPVGAAGASTLDPAPPGSGETAGHGADPLEPSALEPDASTSAPQAENRRWRPLVAGAGLLAVSAGTSALTVFLRRRPILLARTRAEECETEEEFGAALGCSTAGGISYQFDLLTYWGLSYLTSMTAVGALIGAGHVFGRARRMPVRRPKAYLGAGIALAAGGFATWLVPRIGPGDGDRSFDSLNPTFYAGIGAMGLGTAIIAFAESAKNSPRRTPIAVGFDGRMLSVAGRF